MSRKQEQKLIRVFGESMQEKLDERSKKYGRLGWRNKRTGTLFAWLQDEVQELYVAIDHRDKDVEEIHKECADVALLALMIWDKTKK